MQLLIRGEEMENEREKAAYGRNKKFSRLRKSFQSEKTALFSFS